MEDRHYLSEPRPIAGLKLPTWEVDVMRDGVDMPILTLQVDNHVLPPRKRKKKVVWKLPDDLSNNPKFGMEDKRRILELFKQKKKELKRARKSQTATTANANASNSGQNSPSSSGSTNKPKLLQRMSSSGLSVVDSYTTANEEQPEDDHDPGEEEEEEESKVQERPEIGRGEEKVDYSTTNRGGSSPQPPGFGMSGISGMSGMSGMSLEEPLAAAPPRAAPAVSLQPPQRQQQRQPLPPPPPLQQPTPPPPSFQPLQERSHSFAGSRGPPMSSSSSPSTAMPLSSTSTSSSPLPPPPMPPPGLQRSSLFSSNRRASTSSIPPPGMLRAPGRHFLVPNHDTNNNHNNNCNNALGHVVMETYYMLLRQGMVQELASYYLPNAQKSLTVGGAHALCTRVDQRIQQLTSLANMVLTVKGVLQHPRIDDGDAGCCCCYFIMITGTSVRPQCLPFCHSLTLKQVGPQAFQIQNDALAFLTTEG